MFPEYRGLVAKLKQEDARFARLFDEHNELDNKTTGLINNSVTGGLDEIGELKKQKLQLKDRLYEILRRADGERTVGWTMRPSEIQTAFCYGLR